MHTPWTRRRWIVPSVVAAVAIVTIILVAIIIPRWNRADGAVTTLSADEVSALGDDWSPSGIYVLVSEGRAWYLVTRDDGVHVMELGRRTRHVADLSSGKGSTRGARESLSADMRGGAWVVRRIADAFDEGFELRLQHVDANGSVKLVGSIGVSGNEAIEYDAKSRVPATAIDDGQGGAYVRIRELFWHVATTGSVTTPGFPDAERGVYPNPQPAIVDGAGAVHMILESNTHPWLTWDGHSNRPWAVVTALDATDGHASRNEPSIRPLGFVVSEEGAIGIASVLARRGSRTIEIRMPLTATDHAAASGPCVAPTCVVIWNGYPDVGYGDSSQVITTLAETVPGYARFQLSDLAAPRRDGSTRYAIYEIDVRVKRAKLDWNVFPKSDPKDLAFAATRSDRRYVCCDRIERFDTPNTAIRDADSEAGCFSWPITSVRYTTRVVVRRCEFDDRNTVTVRVASDPRHAVACLCLPPPAQK